MIACKVLQREAYYCAARSENIVDIVFLEQGLHDTPDKLCVEVQKALDVIEDCNGNAYDASLLGYGLCSNGIVGLNAKIPIVVPRGHDCITVLLGSKEKYREYFDSHRGIYWYSSGWIDTSAMPSKERYEQKLKEYVEKYGENNAKYLMETEQGWLEEYERATYIDWGFAGADKEKSYTKQCAEYLGWKYEELKGDPGLFQRLCDGHWSQEDFLTVEPGQSIVEDLTSKGIIGAQ